ncbi:MAG: hypothetical protein EA001_05410 [Oscillatoriales cyanobacterium]|nr:MAG: hypothetical protein EA001_05410 [Oscillatoriales cyanobacterium]
MIPGWTLARTIPAETLMNLMVGQYRLCGGVIRWAAGTAQAGQIVQHLIPVSAGPLGAIPGLGFVPGIIANVQLHDLQKLMKAGTQQLIQLSGQVGILSHSTQHILQLATGTAVFSGLGLAVSSIGFLAMNHKLSKIDSRLKEIQKDVQSIKLFLESSERAKLFAALNALLKIDERTDLAHRHTILHQSRNTLAEIHMRYRELLTESKDLKLAIAREEYFALTALAQIRCTAELGMLDIAHKEAKEVNEIWQGQARRIAREILIGEYPERFLATDFADTVSVVELAQWMDFIQPEERGLGWVDELRSKMNETWYAQGWLINLGNLGSGLSRNVGLGLDQEKQVVIPTLRKLLARSAVFEGYVAQYEFLEAQQLRPSDLETQLASLPESHSIEDYLILEPALN